MPSHAEAPPSLDHQPAQEVSASPSTPDEAPPDPVPPVAEAEEAAEGGEDEEEEEEEEEGEEEEGEKNQPSPMLPNTDGDNCAARPTLEDSQNLFDSGCASLRSEDYEQASDSLSRALEIRAWHFGELAFECAFTYYKYGCALLYKYQAESDPLKDPASLKNATQPTSSYGANEKGQEDEGRKGEQEDEVVEEDLEEEEESDLDLSWKMLDIARAIYEKQSCHSIEEVDVITTLADVSLEREDYEMCFRDYSRALEILEGLVEPDNRRIAELFFKLSLAHQLGYKPKDALKYCQQAVSLCEARLRRLKNEVEVTKGTGDLKGKSISCSVSPEENLLTTGEKKDPLLSNAIENSGCTEQDEEIKEIEQLLEELRDKVTELEEMAVAPSLLDTLKATNPGAVNSIQQVFTATAKLASGDNRPGSSSHRESSSDGFDAPSAAICSAPVTHLGIVGRGVKRAAPARVQNTENGHEMSVRKRTLDDMFTRGGAGETQIGFGSPAMAGEIFSVNGQPLNLPDDTTQGKL